MRFVFLLFHTERNVIVLRRGKADRVLEADYWLQSNQFVWFSLKGVTSMNEVLYFILRGKICSRFSVSYFHISININMNTDNINVSWSKYYNGCHRKSRYWRRILIEWNSDECNTIP